MQRAQLSLLVQANLWLACALCFHSRCVLLIEFVQSVKMKCFVLVAFTNLCATEHVKLSTTLHTTPTLFTLKAVQLNSQKQRKKQNENYKI